MSEDLITPENLSKELLKSVFDTALMDVSYDRDGDLKVKDRVTCFVHPNDQKDKIRLVTYFGFKSEASQQQRLECANHINHEYIIVRAAVISDVLKFDYDLPITGGITKKALILTFKRFCSIPHDAVAEFGKEIVE